MEGFGFVIFLIVVVALISMAVAAAQKRSTDETYSQLAQRYGGTCEPGGMFSRPSVRFHHDGSWVVIDVHSTGGEDPTYYTQAHFFYGAGRRPVRCIVFPEGIWTGVRKFLGMEDIEIGSPGFDKRYIIQGDDGAELREFLHAGVQLQIDELRRFLGNDDIYISSTQKELLVKKRSYIKNLDSLVRFVELAVGLYDQAARPSDEGIDFVKDAPPPELTEAVCQVCGEPIGSQVVFCRRCKTPHHQECWQYYGACSTYGCLEKRYMRPESRRAERVKQRMRR